MNHRLASSCYIYVKNTHRTGTRLKMTNPIYPVGRTVWLVDGFYHFSETIINHPI